MRSLVHFFLIVLLFSALLVGRPASGQRTRIQSATASIPKLRQPDSAAQQQLRQAYGQLPISFERNQGQTADEVKYLARGRGYALFLTANEAVLKLQQARIENPQQTSMEQPAVASHPMPAATVRMKLVHANSVPVVRGEDELAGKSHYLLGNDSQRWRTNVPLVGKVRYEAVWPGVDLLYYGNQQQLEYDFIVNPNADPQKIRLRFEGAKKLRTDKAGNLILQLDTGELLLRRPTLYQEVNGRKQIVRGRFRLHRHHEVSFSVGRYNKTRPLVIDPVLTYSSPLGGQATDVGYAVAVDQNGSAYIAGASLSTDFPGGSPMQPLRGEGIDAFVLKLNPAGTALMFATWLGGEGDDRIFGLTLDAAGNAYLTGTTSSTNFPTTSGALQTSPGGVFDAFAAKINPTGSAFLYSTRLGGNQNDIGYGIAADAAGNVYLTGQTDSTNLPATGIQTTRRGSPVYRLSKDTSLWTVTGEGLVSSFVNAFAFDPTNTTTIYAATSQNVFKSTDGGTSWRLAGNSRTNDVPQNTQVLAIASSAPQTLYAVSDNKVWKSTNGGDTWSVKNNGLPATLPFLTEQLSLYSLAIDPTAPQIVYAGTNAGVYKTTDGGDNWALSSSGMPISNNRYPLIAQLIIDPAKPATLYAATQFGAYKTTNSGASWAAINQGLIDVGVASAYTMVADPVAPSTTLWFLSREQRLYKTTNGGASWEVVNRGVTINRQGISRSVFFITLAIDPQTPTTLYAGTASDGLFKSTDGGVTWQPVDFPARNLAIIALAYDRTNQLLAGTASGTDSFVAKLNASGTTLNYLTYLGGTGNDSGTSIAVSNDGSAYVTGSTNSPDFPLASAFQSTPGGLNDAFVTKLNPAGSSLVYSTYLGGSFNDAASGIAVDDAGSAFLTGATQSVNFPTMNPLFSKQGEPGTSSDPTAANDVFITRFNVAGSALVFSTFLGGSSGRDAGTDIALDRTSNIWVVGTTTSYDFPTVNALQTFNQGGFGSSSDAFIARLNNSGTKMLFSTWLGGQSTDEARSVAVDKNGSVYVTGNTQSSNFPVTNSILPFTGFDAFVTKLTPQADLSLTLTDQPDPAQAETELTCLVTISNDGPDSANDVMVNVTLPAATSGISFTTSKGSCSGSGSVNCALGEMQVNAKAVINVNFKAPGSGSVTSSASVTSQTVDPRPANNSATQETRRSSLPSIFGTVTLDNGEGLSGVKLTLNDASNTMVTTKSDGSYQFAELSTGGNFSLTPLRNGYVFLPSGFAVTNLTTDRRFDCKAIPCVFAVAPLQQTFPATGGTGSVTITAPDARCTWTARSNVPWINLTSAASGAGNAIVSFSIAPTVGSRTGTLVIGEQLIHIRQEFYPCNSVEFPVPRTITLENTFINTGIPQFVVADFNRDGVDDPAFISALPATAVLVALSNQAGGLNAPINVMTSGEWRSIHAADLNNDGNADLLAIGNDAQGTLSVVYGNGTGGFSAKAALTSIINITALTTGDFNGDGRTDLLLGAGPSTPGPIPPPTSRNVVFLPGTETGLGTPKTFSLTTSPIGYFLQVEAGDFDGDKKTDAMVLDYEGFLTFMKGDGAGGFTLQTVSAQRALSRLMTTGDFNGDGKRDLALLSGNEVNLIQQSSGGFVSTTRQNVNAASQQLAARDFNRDGRDDLAVKTSDGIAVLYGRSDGRLDEPIYYVVGLTAGFFGTGGLGGNQLPTSDFNRDGLPDILVPVRTSVFSSGGPITLAYVTSLGGRSFAAPRSFPYQTSTPSSLPRAGLAEDLNDDGLTDLIVIGDSSQCVAMLGNGRGEFNSPITIAAGEFPAYPAIRDFNLDGRRDLAVLNSSQATVTILFGDGTGRFPASVKVTTGNNPYNFAAGDFNNDGKPDLIVRGKNAGLALMAGDGKGNFAESATGIAAEFNTPNFTAADLTGDGYADLAVWNQDFSNSCFPAQNRLAVFAGDGRGGFALLTDFTLRYAAQSVEAADLTQDGRADLLIRTVCSQDANVYVASHSQNGLNVLLSIPAAQFANGKMFADLNGDGISDLLRINENFIQLMTGKGNSSFNDPVTVTSLGGAVIAGDFNEDGKTDLAIARSGNAAVLLNRAACYNATTLVITSAASYASSKVTREAIVTAFGAGLAGEVQSATTVPLLTSLGGTSVRIKDAAGAELNAPLFFVSPGQINFLIPTETAAGNALVTVIRDSHVISTGTIEVAGSSPGLFTADASGQGLAAALIVRVKADGTQVYESMSRFDAMLNKFVAVPVDVSNPNEQVFLIPFGTGFRYHKGGANVSAKIGGENAEVIYAGAQGGFVGLDQLNIRIPSSLTGRGEAEVVVTIDGHTANTIRLVIK